MEHVVRHQFDPPVMGDVIRLDDDLSIPPDGVLDELGMHPLVCMYPLLKPPQDDIPVFIGDGALGVVGHAGAEGAETGLGQDQLTVGGDGERVHPRAFFDGVGPGNLDVISRMNGFDPINLLGLSLLAKDEEDVIRAV